MNFAKYFTRGLKNTLRLINGVNFSHQGPWVSVGTNGITVDNFHVGDFMAVDYTIAVDHSTGKKELIKCLVVAGPQEASLTIYGRTNLGENLVELTATVDSSRVFLNATPANSLGGKLIFSANYYKTLNELHV